ncbi:MAG: CopD family protein [Chloroflexota bacterium]
MSPLVLAISYFFHLLATVVWLGGLAILTILVHPAAKRTLNEHPSVYTFLNQLRKRFVPLANFSLAVLITSGMIQMAGDENYLGVLDFSNGWSVAMLLKHIAVAGMAICSLTIQYGVAPALERTGLLIARGKPEPEEWERLQRREQQLTWANNVLGIMVLVFTAYMTAL